MKINSKAMLKLFLTGVFCASLISACNLPDGALSNFGNSTEVDQPIDAPTIQHVAATSSISALTESTPQINIITPTTGQPVTTNSNTPNPGDTNDALCNQASPGTPLDVTIPDNTRLEPNENFSKIWRLVNSGTCVWSSDYALVWFSGDDFGAGRAQPILSNVRPGDSVDFTVDMVAPDVPGLYSGYWMLRSGSGDLFGIGPAGDSPFWVRIQVVAVNTIAPTVSPAPRPTSIVVTTGSAKLSIGQSIDLDSGAIDQIEQADARVEQIEAEQIQWSPMNEGRFAVYGLTEPREDDCTHITLSEQPIVVNRLEPGIFLCYRTGDGLPGMMQFEFLLVEEARLKINFTTWAVQ